MKVSLNLIKQLTRVKLGSDELLARIGSRLAEVENVEKLADRYQGILVAEIKKAKEHPDADKLGIYQIFNGKDTIQVVAGDKTLKVGDKVAHIAPGLTVPATFYDDEPFILKKRELRGEISNGMLGSAKELAFGDEHSKVLKLDTRKPAGTPLIEAYDLDDLIIEVENKTLTHRPDAFGLIGFAREIAGIQDLKFSSPEWLLKTVATLKNNDQLKLNVKNEVLKDCPTYLAVAVAGVKIKQSPVQLMSYLSRLGIRPLSNIVDMTNYYMLLTGQPLHAFDYDKVKNGRITVRYPKKGEKLELLDGRKIEPHKKAVAICDDNGPIALGGVMGGADSEISPKTKNIIIECANFDMYSIRKTSMEHGIFSDAATRFMRGQSPALCEKVLAEIISQPDNLGGGKIASAVIGQPSAVKPVEVPVRFEDVNRLLGIAMPADEQKRRLENVELSVSGNKVKIPYWRRDLNLWQDVAEEIGRLSGFDNIETTLPVRSVHAVDYGGLEKLQHQVRQLLSAAGANEVLTYSGISPGLLEKLSLDGKQLYHIRNSLSPELGYMRSELISSLLEKVHPNHRRGFDEFALFEIGKVHSKRDVGSDGLPVEQERLSLVFSASDKLADAEYGGSPYFQAKQYLDYLLRELGIETVNFTASANNQWPEAQAIFSSKNSAAISAGNEFVGVIGEFAPTVKRNLKLRDFGAGFEIDLAKVLQLTSGRIRYEKLRRYPGSQHDVTFETPQKVLFRQVFDDFSGRFGQKDLVTSVEPIDVYRKTSGAPTKNITLRLSIANTAKTMSSKEINTIVDRAVAASEKALGLKRI